MGPSSPVLLAVILAIAGGHWVETHRTLPVHLQRCYGNDGVFVPNLPLNLQVVLDVIRKLERKTMSSMSMRTLSAALFKRFKLDGVRYSESMALSEGVLRFAARGWQRAKHRLVEELLPGDASLLPESELTRDEFCLLHFAMSNTIWDHFENVEEDFCRPGPTDRIAGRSITESVDRCPKEGGAVLTGYGTVALGSVIAAVAAGLEPQVVKTKLLLTMPVDEEAPRGAGGGPRASASTDEELVEFVLPRAQIGDSRSMWLKSATIMDTQIDNAWAATVAGELAEMVIYQGPVYEDRMFLGATGFWNNTIRPRVYYVSHKHNNFDATRAEIVGGVDGIIIAKNLNTWTQKFENLRLSQVLDMYYSDTGIVFDKSVKACQRGVQFPIIGPKSLIEEQTYATAQVLAYLNSVAAISDEALQRMVVRSVEYFGQYTDERLFAEARCLSRRRRISRLEVLVAFDGAWTTQYTTDFLAVLADDFDVSFYGSKMGIIHGANGEWIQNVTGSLSTIHQSLNNLTEIQWPKGMKLSQVFQSVLNYLDSTWEQIRNNNTIGNFGQAVVLLIPQTNLSDEEGNESLKVLKEIKSKHPETRFLYFTVESDVEKYKRFLLSEEDRIVQSLDVDDISRILSAVPRTLRPVGCNKNIPGLRLQLEDYVNPADTIVYRLHPQWRIKSKKITVTIHGVGYGTLQVCWWNQWTVNSLPTGKKCENLDLYGDVTLTDNRPCNKNHDCPDTYFQVQNVTTTTKCAEIDCRTPDQVRFILRMENMQCASSNRAVIANFLLLLTLAVTVTYS